MANTRIVNAAPMVIARGIQDLSTRTPVIDPVGLPTHLPKVYIYAAWGPTDAQLVSGANRTNIYAQESFDLRLPYANHQTVLSNVVAAAGNAQMLERVLPDDVGPRSNILLSLEVVASRLPVYQRNADGTLVKDNVTGLPIQVTNAGTPQWAQGHLARWVTNHVSTLAAETNFGQVTSSVGELVSLDTTPVQSTRYPILELRASCYGARGNDAAVRLWAPNQSSSTPVNSTLMDNVGAYPVRLAVTRRASAKETAKVVQTLGGDQYVEFVFKDGAIDPVTNTEVSFTKVFPSAYRNIEDTTAAINYGDFGDVHLYSANLKLVSDLVFADEVAATTNVSGELKAAGATSYLVNLLTGTYSSGEPYHHFEVDSSSAGSVWLGESTNVFAAGGADGTMNDTAFAALVSTAVAAYADPNHKYQDDAKYPESFIYDTGFPLTTKRALCQFISERKDTAVVLSTYTVGGQELTRSQESSIGTVLKSYLQLYPESDYFGTSTVRGIIVTRYGELVNSVWKGKLPLTIEVANMAATMMGASNGVWKSSAVMDSWPNTRVKMFKNINVTNMPASARNSDWAIGLNWVQAYDTQNCFFPAIHTVCDNDTSIFTSFVTMACAVELQKVGMRTWRDFTGNITLTSDQFIDRVNRKVEERTIGRFCDLFKIVPECLITSADAQRGYSWTLPITLYANNMKTVMTLDVRGRRMSDLTA